jgi:hypothetical protein
MYSCFAMAVSELARESRSAAGGRLSIFLSRPASGLFVCTLAQHRRVLAQLDLKRLASVVRR